MRRAAARAASRRGSSKRRWPRSARPASSKAGGTRVVLPAPVGARSTTHEFVRSVAINCGSTGSIGRGCIVAPLSPEAGARGEDWSRRLALGLTLRARLGQRADEIENGSELGQAHAVAVEEFLQREVRVEPVAVLLADGFGQVRHELAVRPFDDRQRLATSRGQIGKLFLPAIEKRPPPAAHVLRRPQLLELLFLHFEHLPQQVHALGHAGRRRHGWYGRGGGQFKLKVHGYSQIAGRTRRRGCFEVRLKGL